LDSVTQAVAVPNQLPVDKNNHVLPNPSLLIEDVPSRARMFPKIVVQHDSKSRAGNFTRGTFDMTLNVSSEPDGGHKLVSVPKEFC
jgi:hypothetical protein